MNRNASFKGIARIILDLPDEQQLAIVDSPGKFKELMKQLTADVASNIYVTALSDGKAVKLLVDSKKYESVERVWKIVALWRKYASNIGYAGPVAWKVREGFTLKTHAPLAGPCYSNLEYLKDWDLKNDEPTKDSLVFWVPRLAEGSTSKTIPQMEELREAYRRNYNLPAHHGSTFGSIALLFALILAHFKRTGERVPLKYLYAASDSFFVGHRLVAGRFSGSGLYCDSWFESTSGGFGFFLLGVEELGQ